MRLELVLLFVVLFAVAMAGIWLGWRNRGRRQSDLPELPAVPSELGADTAPAFEGLYLGTTTARQWQDRIVARGLGGRANFTARLTSAGVYIDRVGSQPLFLPDDALLDARLEPAIAGKVVGEGGILVLRWRLGESELDTGLRGDDRSSYVPWIRAIENRAATKTTGGLK
jgi:hypothetical protein